MDVVSLPPLANIFCRYFLLFFDYEALWWMESLHLLYYVGWFSSEFGKNVEDLGVGMCNTIFTLAYNKNKKKVAGIDSGVYRKPLLCENEV